VGSPAETIEKILFQHQLFGHQRRLLQLGISTIAHAKLMRAIELLGTQVAPVVRQEIARRNGTSNAPPATTDRRPSEFPEPTAS
jgi:hypothetical protein